MWSLRGITTVPIAAASANITRQSSAGGPIAVRGHRCAAGTTATTGNDDWRVVIKGHKGSAVPTTP